jgi:hypothetical protein
MEEETERHTGLYLPVPSLCPVRDSRGAVASLYRGRPTKLEIKNFSDEEIFAYYFARLQNPSSSCLHSAPPLPKIWVQASLTGPRSPIEAKNP